MMLRSSFPILGFLVLVLAGCAAHRTNDRGPADTEGVVRGTVAYRERVALPPDAVVEVWMTDASPMNLAVPVIAETTVQPRGRQVPLPFELRYDPGRIESDHGYGVKAVIRSGGRILFQSQAVSPAITKGNPRQVELWLVRAADDTGGEAGGAAGLGGTAWRLEDLGGAGVLDNVEATLEFPETGKVAGRGSCNRFFGEVEISGQSIGFGALGSTRMSCVEAVMNQEAKYLKALEGAERFMLDGSMLLIYSKGMDQPLRFMASEP
jgi:putative lipoprotein